MQRLFRATRRLIVTEEVEVFANHADEAREKFEDDDEDVKILSRDDEDYEVHHLSIIEIKE